MVMESAVHEPRPASLEGIPDDILYEILSYLPTLTESHILFTCFGYKPVIPSTSLVRMPVLRALSRTSQLLRFRCLPMAWHRLELCTAPISKYGDYMCCGLCCAHLRTYRYAVSRAVAEVTETAMYVLDGCPHLHPFIRTVSVILTNFRSDKVIPSFAACLTQMPNLTSIQVIYVDSMYIPVDIEKGFQSQQFPSVRKVSLPYIAHPILRSLPNVEEVVCIEGSGNEFIDSIVKGNCRRVRMLKGVKAPLAPLVPLLPDLRYIGVHHEDGWDMNSLADFPFLDTIEITSENRDQPLPENQMKEASDVLKANASRADNKAVILTHRTRCREEVENVTSQVIKV